MSYHLEPLPQKDRHMAVVVSDKHNSVELKRLMNNKSTTDV